MEVFGKTIAEQLIPSSSFVMESLDESQWVNAKVVNSPVAGLRPIGERDRESLPAPIGRRIDLNAPWELREFTTNPTVLTNAEEAEFNYNKRASLLTAHTEQLELMIANYMQYVWSVGATVRRTSGANVAALGDSFGATGNRKRATISDIAALAAVLDDQDVPLEGRCLLLPASMYHVIKDDNKLVLMNLENNGEAQFEGGELSVLYGFKIYKRGKRNLLTFDNATNPAPRDPKTSTNATNVNAAALAWSSKFVLRAIGGNKLFYQKDAPELYGDVMSCLQRAGGRTRYLDGTGCVALVETS